jgi:hypothetical protein
MKMALCPATSGSWQVLEVLWGGGSGEGPSFKKGLPPKMYFHTKLDFCFIRGYEGLPVDLLTEGGKAEMLVKQSRKILCIVCLLMALIPCAAWAQVALLEFSCPACGFRDRFVQGSKPSDQERNVQYIIVVCERTAKIRNIAIPLDPSLPVKGEPLVARQYGTGLSELLGTRLPRFLVPGNTCPLFPVAAYLERNICPVDGSRGIHCVVVGRQ